MLWIDYLLKLSNLWAMNHWKGLFSLFQYWNIECIIILYIYYSFLFRAAADSSDYRYNQPKFIVFYEMLLKIFLLFCFNCKENNPQVSMVQNGTIVTVRQKCAKCIKGYVWTSQRMMPHGKYPAGNESPIESCCFDGWCLYQQDSPCVSSHGTGLLLCKNIF